MYACLIPVFMQSTEHVFNVVSENIKYRICLAGDKTCAPFWCYQTLINTHSVTTHMLSWYSLAWQFSIYCDEMCNAMHKKSFWHKDEILSTTSTWPIFQSTSATYSLSPDPHTQQLCVFTLFAGENRMLYLKMKTSFVPLSTELSIFNVDMAVKIPLDIDWRYLPGSGITPINARFRIFWIDVTH